MATVITIVSVQLSLWDVALTELNRSVFSAGFLKVIKKKIRKCCLIAYCTKQNKVFLLLFGVVDQKHR